MTFNEAKQHARMTGQEIANYLDLHPATISRYITQDKAPKAVIECLLMIGGFCPEFSYRNEFSGWRFSNGMLHTPEGDKFTSGDVRAGKTALLEMNRLHRLQIRQRKEAARTRPNNIIQFPKKLKRNELFA